ncbi:hypothetical protein [Psychromonas sp.]|uniref:hypothetical protein n=1 Tax=Psychromonas sp. TaxID=1884585 RepID=UPI003569C5B7
MKQIATVEELSVALPCNRNKQVIPSPIIANLNNLQDSEGDYAGMANLTLNVIKIEQPLAF